MTGFNLQVWITIGQQHSINIFKRALKSGSIAHAYLLSGPEHIGKNTMACDFAMALNCLGNDIPCRECISCHRIIKNNHSDIIRLSLSSELTKNSSEKTYKTEIGIDDIRNLQHMLNLPPYEGKYKVFIIDGADSLSNEAANCILKVLEEPTPRIIIMLLAVDEKNVLPTVVSRCQRIPMKPVPNSIIENYLIKEHKLEQEKAKFLSRLATGHPGFAISAVEDDNFLTDRNDLINILFPLIYSSLDYRFDFVRNFDGGHKFVDAQKRTGQLLNIWLSWWQDLLLVKCNCPDNIVNLDKIVEFINCSQEISLDEITRFIGSIKTSLSCILKNANIRLVLEVLMFHMPFKPALQIINRQKSKC